MAHKTRDTAVSTVGFESSIRASWSAGDKVKILSSTSNDWVTAHIVTIHKDNLYCLLEDGDTKKIDRYDSNVQPHSTTDGDGGEDDEELYWLKDGNETPTGNQSMSLGFSTLSAIRNEPDFHSSSIMKNSPLSPTTKHRESIKNVKNIGNALTAEEEQFQKMCGYTIWVQWCDSQELHGYYQCVGLRNNRYHFKHRRDNLAELFADDKGYWYLMYDGKCLYKSKRKGYDDPPPRNWKCIEGSLPPPGVSQVALPDDSRPMVVFDEEKLAMHDGLISPRVHDDEDTDDETTSNVSGYSRQTTVNHTQSAALSPSGQHTASAFGTEKKGKSKKSKKGKKSKKNKLNVAKLLMDEFDVDIEVLDFHFDGSKQVAFHLNIARHMEVTKVKEGGQAEKLGVLQGDILLKINEEDVSKNWEKATGLLRTLVQKKQKFTITFVRRMVEYLSIKVVRAGTAEYNGTYKFYKRDPEDDMCPIYVKNDHDDEFDFTGIDAGDDSKFDPLNSESDAIRIIQRVYSNPENSEALWVLRNGKDEHNYMCVTNEYLPPQHGWELVPDSEAKYPAPGLQFASSKARFDQVNRLRGDTTTTESERPNVAGLDRSATNRAPGNDAGDGKQGEIHAHDALNVSNRNRTNKHQHEKTLTRMRQTLGSAMELNNAISSGTQRSHTGGVSGYVAGVKGGGRFGAVGLGAAGGKRGGLGSKIFGGSKKNKVQAQPVMKSSGSGNESAPETDEDSAKIEAVWKQKLEATTKNAINQLTTKHQEEISKKEQKVENLNESVEHLRNNLQESQEYYYHLYIEKCGLSLLLQEKQVELDRSKQKQKEMGKRYFQAQQRTEELETKLSELSQSFTSRMTAIQSKPATHRPTKSTVNDLASIEQQFRNLLSVEKSGGGGKKHKASGGGGGGDDDGTAYLENEMIKLNEQLSVSEDKVSALQEENEKLKSQIEKLQNQMSAKKGGADQYYQDRATKLSAKVGAYQQNIYNLMSLLQSVEQEYMQKCGKLPKATMTVDWRNAYDPKKYKLKQQKSATKLNQSTTQTPNTNGAHPTHQTFVVNDSHQKKGKKQKKSKHKEEVSATQSMVLPHAQRWGGFNLGSSGDEADGDNKQRHRGKKENESRIIDL